VDFVTHHFLNPMLFFRSNDVSRKSSAILYAFFSFCDSESTKSLVLGVVGGVAGGVAGGAILGVVGVLLLILLFYIK
jgi:hypothetical protein